MHPEAVTPHIANLAHAKGFRWVQSGKLRQDEYTRGALHKWLREEHNLDVCFYPQHCPSGKTYYVFIDAGRPRHWAWSESGFVTLELGLEAAFEAALNLIP